MVVHWFLWHFILFFWAEQKQVSCLPHVKCWTGSSVLQCKLSVCSGSSFGKNRNYALWVLHLFLCTVMFHLSSSFNLSCQCVWNHEKLDPMMECSSNPLYEYVNIFVNGYILTKHYLYYMLMVFHGWSTNSCATSVTSTMHASKFWTSKMWGLGWRSSLRPGMWLCGTRLRPQVSRHDTCLMGL
jgi:hypothetical protein